MSTMPLVLRGREFPIPVVLAPMAGITNQAFRRLCREHAEAAAPDGAGLFVSEMVTSRALLERNAGASWYPASLTKMMTIYLVFEQLKSGRLTLATPFALSEAARARPPSKLGLGPGQTITVDAFTPGEYVNVAGVSKGRGWAGGVKRWHFRGGPKTHGQSDRHRAPGSVGSGTTPGKVWKGQKMAGHMGDRNRTQQNLEIVSTDVERGLILVEGAVPGTAGGWIYVRDAVKKALPKDAPKPGKFRVKGEGASLENKEA